VSYDATHARLRARFGSGVEAWWQAVPALLAELSDRWAVTLGEPVGRGNTSLVIRCHRADGGRAIVKLTPDTRLAVAEATALKSWASSERVPELWAHDTKRGALLLEAIGGEVPLSESATTVPVEHIAPVIHALHTSGLPVNGSGIGSLTDRVDFLFNYWTERSRHQPEVIDLIPPTRLKQGHELARHLAGDSIATVLLHGDLHPGNVLDSRTSRGLVAIDPRPCMGDPAFDAIDWVFAAPNPTAWSARSDALAAALDIPAERVARWSSAMATLLAAGRASRGASAEVAVILELAA